MKKKILKSLQTTVIPYILQLIVRLIYLTNKTIFHHPTDDKDKTFIVSMWHGDLLMQPFNYQKFKPNGSVKAMISEHRDGETIRKTVKYLGIGSIDGSSTRGGVKALISGIKELRGGGDIAITPDGPKGPLHSVADGIVLLAQKTKTPIRTLSCIPTKYWQFKSWDKFTIPKPFGTIDFYISEAFYLDDLSTEDAKKLILDKMEKNQLNTIK